MQNQPSSVEDVKCNYISQEFYKLLWLNLKLHSNPNDSVAIDRVNAKSLVVYLLIKYLNWTCYTISRDGRLLAVFFLQLNNYWGMMVEKKLITFFIQVNIT